MQEKLQNKKSNKNKNLKLKCPVFLMLKKKKTDLQDKFNFFQVY